jgi:hypothetical protein
VPAADAIARHLDRWKLSLLDLTLRNRLLDARDGRQVVPLAGVDRARAGWRGSTTARPSSWRTARR